MRAMVCGRCGWIEPVEAARRGRAGSPERRCPICASPLVAEHFSAEDFEQRRAECLARSARDRAEVRKLLALEGAVFLGVVLLIWLLM